MRQQFVDKIKSQIGKPYIWGGQSPKVGFDCSGLVVWGLKEIGCTINHHGEDFTSLQLSKIFFPQRVTKKNINPGCLYFYGKTKETINHVMVVVEKWSDGTIMLIGARGGDSTTIKPKDSSSRKACVDLTFGNYWAGNLQLIVDPFKERV